MVDLKQFDVFPNPKRERRATHPFIVVLQSDLMPNLKTRVVAPRIPVTKIAGWERLMPEVSVAGNRYVISMPDLGAMPVNVMLPAVANLEDHRYRIIGAIDLIFTGV